jgi:hypothetical protein
MKLYIGEEENNSNDNGIMVQWITSKLLLNAFGNVISRTVFDRVFLQD